MNFLKFIIVIIVVNPWLIPGLKAARVTSLLLLLLLLKAACHSNSNVCLTPSHLCHSPSHRVGGMGGSELPPNGQKSEWASFVLQV